MNKFSFETVYRNTDYIVFEWDENPARLAPQKIIELFNKAGWNCFRSKDFDYAVFQKGDLAFLADEEFLHELMLREIFFQWPAPDYVNEAAEIESPYWFKAKDVKRILHAIKNLASPVQ